MSWLWAVSGWSACVCVLKDRVVAGRAGMLMWLDAMPLGNWIPACAGMTRRGRVLRRRERIGPIRQIGRVGRMVACGRFLKTTRRWLT